MTKLSCCSLSWMVPNHHSSTSARYVSLNRYIITLLHHSQHTSKLGTIGGSMCLLAFTACYQISNLIIGLCSFNIYNTKILTTQVQYTTQNQLSFIVLDVYHSGLPIRSCTWANLTNNKVLKMAIVTSVEAMIDKIHLYWTGHIWNVENCCLLKVLILGVLFTNYQNRSP